MSVTPTPEQQAIADRVATHNLVVDSVAGSGKTTTILHIAETYPDSRILGLTYSAKLKLETQEKVRLRGLTNIEVHSFHACALKYYMSTNGIFTDEHFEMMFEEDYLQPKYPINFDIIIVDEAQDLTKLYYKLICQLVKDCSVMPKLCIIGDVNQCIFKFNNSDSRFISCASRVFDFSEYASEEQEWDVSLKLSKSFRLTAPMTRFINGNMLGYQRLIPKNEDAAPAVDYVICNVYNAGNEVKCATSAIVIKLQQYLKTYPPHQIFLLAPSVRSGNTPLKSVEKALQNLNQAGKINVNIFVPVNDEEKLDNEVIANKLVISSFHQSKGLERDCVVVFNFDASYFNYYASTYPQDVCSNELYVATTRARKQLCVVHHSSNAVLPFYKPLVKTGVVYHAEKPRHMNKLKQANKFIGKTSGDISVTELLRNLPTAVLRAAMQYVEYEVIQDQSDVIDIPHKIKCKRSGMELVSEITGTAIPAYYEYKLSGKMKITECDYNTGYEKVVTADLKPAALLRIAAGWCAYTSGYVSKLRQISEHNDWTWLSQENLDKCVARIKPKSGTFEVKYAKNIDVKYSRLTGFIDCVEDACAWEFKCVAELTKTHILQCVLYMYISNIKVFHLHNLINDEIITVRADKCDINAVLKTVLIYRSQNEDIADSDFIDSAIAARDAIFNKSLAEFDV